MNETRLVSLWLSVVLAGCGGGLEGDGYASGASAALTVERALSVSDDLSDFETTSTLSPTREDAAARVETQAREATMGCGTVARSGAEVTLALTRCTLPSGHVVSGSIGITAAVTASSVSLAITFTDVSIDGESLGGSVSLEAGSGALTAGLALSSSRGEVTGDLSLLADPSALTVTGELEVTRDALTSTVTFTSVSYQRGDCYPSGGSIAITTGGTSGDIGTTVTFDEGTASSGVVTVVQGRRSSTEMLPAYGSCPG